MKRITALFLIVFSLSCLFACSAQNEASGSTGEIISAGTTAGGKYTTSHTEEVTSCIMCLPKQEKISGYAYEWGERAYAYRNSTWSVSTNPVSYSRLVTSRDSMPPQMEAYGGENAVANGMFARFDEEFFESHAVLCLTLNFSSGSITPYGIHVADLSDERIDVEIRTLVPEVQTCDMASWTVIIVFDKESLSGREQINVSVS